MKKLCYLSWILVISLFILAGCSSEKSEAEENILPQKEVVEEEIEEPEDNVQEETSVVYMTENISSDSLIAIFNALGAQIEGNVAVKLSTGEPGSNYLRTDLIGDLVQSFDHPTIVECNTAYGGQRASTAMHYQVAEDHGYTVIADVDIMDEEGTAMLPVEGGKWFSEMSVGKNLLNYDSMLALTHFKGHTKGGFGGSNRNIGIGCADGRIGKKIIHTTPGSDDMWDIKTEEFMERMTESTKASIDHFGKQVTYINVMRNMSVSCDCEGCAAMPVVTPNIGITASTDILAVDQASVDLVYALKDEDHKDLVERMETRHGLRQLTYMKELKMGNDKYILIDIDNNDARISLEDAVKDVKPFVDEK